MRGYVVDREQDAVVLLSGGQDSAACLEIACERHRKVYAVGFDYGQRHIVELESAKRIADLYDVPFTTIECSSLRQLGNSGLIDGQIGASTKSAFVPGRNVIFLGAAAAFAVGHDADHVYIGACKSDTMPDCQRDFIVQMECALSSAMGRPVRVHAPLLDLGKRGMLKLAKQKPKLMEALSLSISCYRGTRCGRCKACLARRASYASMLMRDPAAKN